MFERPDGNKSLSSLLPRQSFRLRPSELGLAHSSPVALAELDVVAPPLDGTILPGATRASVLALSHHPHTTALSRLPAHMRILNADCALTPLVLFVATPADQLREVFCIGTAAVVTLAARIGWQRPRWLGSRGGGDRHSGSASIFGSF